MRLFDSHCHLQDARFDKDRKEVLKRASAAGVAAVVVCGEDLASSKAAIALADQSVHPSILPAIGFHPHEAAGATDAALINIQKLAASSQVSAIGEIGLDFYREMAPRHVQRSVFDAQLAIASDMSLPVSIHSRDAEEDLRPHLVPFASKSPLKAQGRPLGVLHAFGGTLRQASEYAELGFLISLTCSAGYPRNSEARRIAANLPFSSLLIETDSPALPPQSSRGTRNEPANLRIVAEVVAEARGVAVDLVATATTANAEALLGEVAEKKVSP